MTRPSRADQGTETLRATGVNACSTHPHTAPVSAHDQVFSRLAGFAAYPFQLRPASHLLSGHNCVLVAPTGAGKSFAALYPFVKAKVEGIPFADKMFVAFPMRTLASSQYESASKALRPFGLRVGIQTGTQPEDPLWESDVVFLTIDQLLAGYILQPYSVSPGSANMLAGALPGAYVVLDEFHLLEPDSALGTVLDMASRLDGLARFLFMSATAPRGVLEELARRAGGAMIERVEPSEAEEIPSQKGKLRRVEWHPEPLTAAQVLEAHAQRRTRTLVVVNTVARAQQLYYDLRGAHERGEVVGPLLLHSRYRPDDRKKHEDTVLRGLGQGSADEALIVTTQVIEVGLDISAEVLLTELAPANALAQRIGRCARFAGETGLVRVFELPVSATGIREPRAYYPYADDYARAAVDATRSFLAERGTFGLDYAGTLAWVDGAHQRDSALLTQLDSRARREKVESSMASGDAAYLRELVRDVRAVGLVIRRAPQAVDMELRPERISVPVETAAGCLRRLLDEGRLAGMAYRPQFDDEGRQTGVVPMSDPKEVFATPVVFLSTEVAAYDDGLGLRLGAEGQWESPDLGPGAQDDRIWTYQAEEYREHVTKAARQADSLVSRCPVGYATVAHCLGAPAECLPRCARMTVALHDIGKLAERVQQPMRRWQSVFGKRAVSGFLAHTDFDGSPEQRKASALPEYKRASHAVEGALALTDSIAELIGVASPEVARGSRASAELIRAALAAIARHHAPRAVKSPDMGHRYELCPGAGQEVISSVKEVFRDADPVARKLNAWQGGLISTLHKAMPGPGERAVFLYYLWLVRVLRLADRASLASGSPGS